MPFRPLINPILFISKHQNRQQCITQEPPSMAAQLVALPVSATLQPRCGQVYDQGNLGSCTANALCSLLNMTTEIPSPSRMFIYTEESMFENGGEIEDTGADVADGCLIVGTKGVCEESFMPYDVQTFGKPPTARAYVNALKHKVNPKLMRDITRSKLAGIQQAIAIQKAPVLLAFFVFSSFDKIGKDGKMPLPSKQDALEGGHEVLCVGYDKDYLLIQNSWGTGWGKKGFFLMPVKYLSMRYQGQPCVMQLLTMGGVTAAKKKSIMAISPAPAQSLETDATMPPHHMEL